MGKTPANTDVKFWRDPDLPGVEVRYSSYNAEAFRKHTHATYSIGLIECGATSFFLEGEIYEAGAGQIALIGPGAVHACNPDSDSGMTYRMFYVDDSWLTSVAEDMVGRNGGTLSFPSPVVDDPSLFSSLLDLYAAISDGADRLEKESLLVQGLAHMLAWHGSIGTVEELSEVDEGVTRVKAHLADNLSEKVSLDELSAVAGVSRYHLLRTFQVAVGLPPHAYQNQLRINLGKRLLADGLPISQTAVEAGFVDQSHFSRVFKQYTGATPRQYQNSLGTGV